MESCKYATTVVVSKELAVIREGVIKDTPDSKCVAGSFEPTEEGHTLKVQCPVYFVSEVLADMKTCYPQIQKLLYAQCLVLAPTNVTTESQR